MSSLFLKTEVLLVQEVTCDLSVLPLTTKPLFSFSLFVIFTGFHIKFNRFVNGQWRTFNDNFCSFNVEGMENRPRCSNWWQTRPHVPLHWQILLGWWLARASEGNIKHVFFLHKSWFQRFSMKSVSHGQNSPSSLELVVILFLITLLLRMKRGAVYFCHWLVDWNNSQSLVQKLLALVAGDNVTN